MKNFFEEEKGGINNYLRYSGLGFQIASIIGVGVFIGYQLDKWLGTSKPYFTLVFSLVFVIIALYAGLRNLAKNDK